MNNDLISREALLVVPNVRKVAEYDETGEYITYFAVPEDVIKNAPTVDAEPVRHGRWICKREVLIEDYYCSVCGAEAIGYDCLNGDYIGVESDFCPHCGAKMDLEDTTP